MRLISYLLRSYKNQLVAESTLTCEIENQYTMDIRYIIAISLILTSSTISAKIYLTPELIDEDLQCNEFNNRICMNGGVCADFSILFGWYEINPACVCQRGFYGPSCEYADEGFIRSRESRMKRRFW